MLGLRIQVRESRQHRGVVAARKMAWLTSEERRKQVPAVSWPQPRVVCALMMIGYFAVSSGVIYDWVTNTPSVGTASDPSTGNTACASAHDG